MYRSISEERFNIICEDPNLYAVFEQYLVTQFSEENLHFYNAVNKFHTLTDQSEIDEAAKRLWTDYFGDEQDEMRLNVSLTIRNKVLKALEHPTTTMFDEAYNDIEQVLKVRPSALTSTSSKAGNRGFRFFFSSSCQREKRHNEKEACASMPPLIVRLLFTLPLHLRVTIPIPIL